MTTANSRQHNRTVLKKGFDLAMAMTKLALRSDLEKKAISIINQEYESKPWQGFTGNAQLSYGFFLYDYLGGNVSQYRTLDHHPSPLRRKVAKGEKVFLAEPYEGEGPRAVIGKAKLETETAQGALTEVQEKPKRGKTKELWRGRFTLAVEYEPFLKGEPFDKLHSTAMLVMSGLGRGLRI